MAVYGVPSPELTNTFVAPGRYLPEVLSPQIAQPAPLDRPQQIDTERFSGGTKARRVEGSAELLSRTVGKMNDLLGQFKVGIGVSVEPGQGRSRIMVRERDSSSLIGEMSAGQLLSAQTRMADAANTPGAGPPAGLFLSQHY